MFFTSSFGTLCIKQGPVLFFAYVYVWCIHMYACVCVWMCVCVCVHVHMEAEVLLGVFLNHSPPYALRQVPHQLVLTLTLLAS